MDSDPARAVRAAIRGGRLLSARNGSLSNPSGRRFKTERPRDLVAATWRQSVARPHS